MAGCVGDIDGKINENELKLLGIAYHNFHDAHRRGPDDWYEFVTFAVQEDFEQADPSNATLAELLQKLQSEGYQLFFGVNFRDIGMAKSDCILAHKPDDEQTGGVVAMLDGSVRYMEGSDIQAALAKRDASRNAERHASSRVNLWDAMQVSPIFDVELVHSPQGGQQKGRTQTIVWNVERRYALRDLLARYPAQSYSFEDFPNDTEHWVIDFYGPRRSRPRMRASATLHVYGHALQSPLNNSIVSTGNPANDRALVSLLKKMHASAKQRSEMPFGVMIRLKEIDREKPSDLCQIEVSVENGSKQPIKIYQRLPLLCLRMTVTRPDGSQVWLKEPYPKRPILGIGDDDYHEIAAGETLVFCRIPFGLKQSTPGLWSDEAHPITDPGTYKLAVGYRHRFASAPLDVLAHLDYAVARFQIAAPAQPVETKRTPR